MSTAPAAVPVSPADIEPGSGGGYCTIDEAGNLCEVGCAEDAEEEEVMIFLPGRAPYCGTYKRMPRATKFYDPATDTTTFYESPAAPARDAAR